MKTRKDLKELFIDYIVILLSSCIIAFAVTSILKPNGLIAGGLTGLSLILEKITGINYIYIFYFVSLLVLGITYIFLGKKEALKIIVFSILLPTTIVVFDKLNILFVENDIFLACIYFGVLIGIGAGITLRRGFSQGGTDTIAKIIHKKVLPFVSISQIILVTDVSVILLSSIVFDRNTALYAAISQVVLAKTIDLVLFGFGSRKVKLEIISKESEKIRDFIVNEAKRGVSRYDIKGGYTDEKRNKLVSICTPREATLIKSYISKTDLQAFVYMAPVISVWGEGVGFETLLEES